MSARRWLGLKGVWILLASVASLGALGGCGEETTDEAKEPEIVSFVATPNHIVAGEETTIRWNTLNASSLSLLSNGTAIDLPSGSNPDGSLRVTLTEPTTYELIARGDGKSVSRSIEVQVVPILVSFSAAPDVIGMGETATLRWEARGAAELTIRGDDGSTVPVGNASADKGEVEVAPEGTTIYTLVAKGKGGEDSGTAKVVVGPVIDELVADVGMGVRAGMEVEVRWKTRGASTLTLTNGGAFSLSLPDSQMEEGSIMAPVHESGTFTLTAERDGQIATKTFTFTPTKAPRILEFDLGPPVTAGIGVEASAEVSWRVLGASSVEIRPSSGPAIALGNRPYGTIHVPVEGPTNFVLMAKNPFGEDFMEMALEVHPVPHVVTFAATPRRGALGEPVTIGWEVEDAAEIALFLDGSSLQVDPTRLVGSHNMQVTSSATQIFELKAKNEIGFEVSEFIEVDVGRPAIATFAVEPERVPTLSTHTFFWENLGGTSLKILDQDEQVVCQTTNASEIARGQCSVTSPPDDGWHDYTMVVTNGQGETSKSLSAFIGTGPIIERFYVNPILVEGGQPITLEWRVLPDISGTMPTVSYRDPSGRHWVHSNSASEGTATITIEETGIYEVTLYAETSGTTPSEVSQTVEVEAFPEVVGAISPPMIETAGMPVNVTFQANAHVVEVYLASRNGNRHASPECRITEPAEVADGQCQVHPTVAANKVHVVAKNRFDTEAFVELDVDVEPAIVSEFVPSTLEVLRGKPVQLEWITERGTEITLTRKAEDGLIDLSENPTAFTPSWIHPTNDTVNSAIIEFPDGFTFPFDGVEHRAAKLSTNGFLTFDIEGTGSSSRVNAVFPDPTKPYVHLAPYWSALSKKRGEVWVGLIEGEQGLAFQWKDMEFNVYSTLGNPASLNFQAILWRDGDFEFRYGELESSIPQWANGGNEVIIGYQNLDGTEGKEFLNKTPYPGGLSGVMFPNKWEGLEASGSLEVFPKYDTLYTLEARNGHSSHSKTVSITVLPNGSVYPTVEPTNPLPGSDFVISWRGYGLTSLTIEDADGFVVCSTTDPAELASGQCDGMEENEGLYEYKARATGVHPNDDIVESFWVHVLPSVELIEFSASPSIILPGESTTITWQVTSAENLLIVDDDGQTIVDIQGPDAESGWIELNPSITTSYHLVGSRHGVVREGDLVVSVRTATIESFEANTSYTAPGEPVVLSWEGGGDGYLFFDNLAMEVYENSPWEDIRFNGGTFLPQANPWVSTIQFPTGFSFPFFGEEVTAIRAAQKGYLSLDLEDTNYPQNSIPSTLNPLRTFMVFWDSSFHNSHGEMWWKFVPAGGEEPAHVIIQWSKMQWTRFFGTPTGDDGNFQAVLYADGSFEYRFGVMMHTDKLNNANAGGATASVGFQDPTGRIFHAAVNRQAFPGGMTDRRFRYQPLRTTGSVTVNPETTTVYRLCTVGAGWEECQEHRAVVVSPGDLLVTEVMTDPAGGGQRWLEVRNMSEDPLPIHEMEASVDGVGEALSSGGPAWLEPGGYHVFGEAPSQEVKPHTILPLLSQLNPLEEFKIGYRGVDIAKFTWAAELPIATGRSLVLDPTHHHIGRVEDDPAHWCLGEGAYDSLGNLGTPGSHPSTCFSDWYDVDWFSQEPFIDIKDTGTHEPALDVYLKVADTGPLGFEMPFFDVVVDHVWATNAGWLSFGPHTLAYTGNREFPKGTANPNSGTVAPFWVGLNIQPTIYEPQSFVHERREIEGRQVAIFQWNNYRTAGFGTLNFQVQLWENGDIVMAYGDIKGNDPTFFGSAASVGMDNPGGTIGITHSYRVPVIRPHRSLLYRYKGGP